MYVCICICMYVCMYVCVYMYLRMYEFICVFIYVSICMYVCTFVCHHTHMLAYIQITHMHACIHTNHTYIHTHHKYKLQTMQNNQSPRDSPRFVQILPAGSCHLHVCAGYTRSHEPGALHLSEFIERYGMEWHGMACHAMPS